MRPEAYFGAFRSYTGGLSGLWVYPGVGCRSLYRGLLWAYPGGPEAYFGAFGPIKVEPEAYFRPIQGSRGLFCGLSGLYRCLGVYFGGFGPFKGKQRPINYVRFALSRSSEAYFGAFRAYTGGSIAYFGVFGPIQRDQRPILGISSGGHRPLLGCLGLSRGPGLA